MHFIKPYANTVYGNLHDEYIIICIIIIDNIDIYLMSYAHYIHIIICIRIVL